MTRDDSRSPTRSPARLVLLSEDQPRQKPKHLVRTSFSPAVTLCQADTVRPTASPFSEKSSTATLLPSYESAQRLDEPLGPPAGLTACGPCCEKAQQRFLVRLYQARVGPLRLIYLITALFLSVCLVAVLLPLLLPQPLTFTVLHMTATAPYTIMDADAWIASVNVTVKVHNPNHAARTWSLLSAHMHTPFYGAPLGTGALVTPLYLPKRSESTWTVPLQLSYSLTLDHPHQPGQGGLDMAISCGYLGQTFTKPLYYRLDLLGQDEAGHEVSLTADIPAVTLVHGTPFTPTLWQTNCPFAMTTLPEHLKDILPSRIQTLTSATANVADRLGGGEGVLETVNQVVDTVGRNMEDLTALGSAVAHWF